MTQENKEIGTTTDNSPVKANEKVATNHVTFNMALSIGALSIVLAVFLTLIATRYAITSGYIELNQSKVVALDTQTLVNAQTKAVMAAGKGDPALIKSESERFASQFNQLAESYKKAGYFIVQSDAVVSYPASANVTPQFIKQLVTKQSSEPK